MTTTIKVPEDLFDELTNTQLGLYVRCLHLCRDRLNKILYTEIALEQLGELFRLGLIYCTFGKSWSYVSVIESEAQA